MASVNIFTRMRELLGPEGERWGQGYAFNLSTHSVCLLGAAHVAACGTLWNWGLPEEGFVGAASGTYNDARDVMAAVLRSKYGDYTPTIDKFNDDRERTFVDIEWLLGECESRPDAPMVEA